MTFILYEPGWLGPLYCMSQVMTFILYEPGYDLYIV